MDSLCITCQSVYVLRFMNGVAEKYPQQKMPKLTKKETHMAAKKKAAKKKVAKKKVAKKK